MNKSKLLDDFLFAPARYLTASGRIEGGGLFRNLTLLPESKVAMIGGLGLAAAFSAAGEKDFARLSALFAPTCAVLASATRRKDALEHIVFFDTNPLTSRPIPSPAIEYYLTKQKSNIGPLITHALVMPSALMTGATLYGDAGAALIGGTIMTAATATRSFSIYWNARQALDGNWNVSTIRPHQKPETVAQPDPKFLPGAIPSYGMIATRPVACPRYSF